ncbi:hypothetical protein OTK49_20845 [Vibrio coralliirubri]|uniref:hypothetical protein n=1 Tax=Vibrio coralliirubri TaxID=1516159 RepID=UPI0022849DE2|nr:hypothetical protein [Vibrio coralliirubri]MCY9864967.1 hypothetical protein [Vibrio coralliirubri]
MTMPLLLAFDLDFQIKTYLDPKVSQSVALNDSERFLCISHDGIFGFSVEIQKEIDSGFPEAVLRIALFEDELVLIPCFSEVMFPNSGLNLTTNKEKSRDAITSLKALIDAKCAVIELIDWIMENEESFIEFMAARRAAILNERKL